MVILAFVFCRSLVSLVYLIRWRCYQVIFSFCLLYHIDHLLFSLNLWWSCLFQLITIWILQYLVLCLCSFSRFSILPEVLQHRLGMLRFCCNFEWLAQEILLVFCKYQLFRIVFQLSKVLLYQVASNIWLLSII